MADLWSVLGALATVVLPMLLAWWLLSQPQQGSDQRDGKIPRKKDR